MGGTPPVEPCIYQGFELPKINTNANIMQKIMLFSVKRQKNGRNMKNSEGKNRVDGALLASFWTIAKRSKYEKIILSRAPDGWCVYLSEGSLRGPSRFYLLGEATGLPRVFKTADTVFRMAMNHGIESIEVSLRPSGFLF